MTHLSTKHRATARAGLAAEIVRSFGEAPFKLVGASMLPSLWPGDVLVVRRAKADGVRTGDLLQFQRHGLLITHRVVSHGGDQLITQGDAVAHVDAPVSEHEIVGRVISVTRDGRQVDPRFTTKRRIAAWALRRSDLLKRVTLRIGRGA